jgi:hypothetical protein
LAYTVAAAFDQFFDKINLPGDHRQTANSRRDALVSLLKNNFEVLEAFPSGSIPRFTAVRGYADLDVMVALHWGKHIKDRTPSEVLDSVRNCLKQYRTGVRRNGQAVTLFYDSWPNVDIVPCARNVDNQQNVTHYTIPDMHRGVWLPSTPKEHSQDIEQKSSLCGESFRRIIKMVKWWNHKHSEYLQSYHIEVIALRAFNGALTDLPWDVLSYFKEAASVVAGPLYHRGSQVDAYLSPVDRRQEARSRLTSAHGLALGAWYATHGVNNDHRVAIGKWRQVFGEEFPAYG